MDPSKFAPALFGAVGGGIIGALIWGAIAYWAHLEIGWIAWGIGALVGGGAGVMGGRGGTMGLLCALIAAGSICAGKVFAVHLMIPAWVQEDFAEFWSHEAFAEAQTDARDFAALTHESQVPAFMVTHHFTEAERPDLVSQEEVEYFNQYSAPALRRFQNEQPSFEKWQSDRKTTITEGFRKNMPLFEALKSTMGLMDIVFFLLGVGTAFKVAAGSDGE